MYYRRLWALFIYKGSEKTTRQGVPGGERRRGDGIHRESLL